MCPRLGEGCTDGVHRRFIEYSKKIFQSEQLPLIPVSSLSIVLSYSFSLKNYFLRLAQNLHVHSYATRIPSPTVSVTIHNVQQNRNENENPRIIRFPASPVAIVVTASVDAGRCCVSEEFSTKIGRPSIAVNRLFPRF